MSDKLWKSIERKVAAYLGGVRIPITGRQRGDVPDIYHPFFSVEVKHRKEVPDWLKEAMGQAGMARRGNQIPLVILHEKGQSIPDCLTIMRLSDILELYKKLEAKNDSE